MLVDDMLAMSKLDPRLRAYLLEAQKFIIADDAARASRQLSEADVEAVADLIRLPFPTTWLEYNAGLQGDGIRIGALLRQPDKAFPQIWDLWGLRRSPKDGLIGWQVIRLSLMSNGRWVFSIPPNAPQWFPNDGTRGIVLFDGNTAVDDDLFTNDITVLEKRTRRVRYGVSAFLALLSAKGATVADYHPTQPRLNKARAKQGKPPLVDYHLLRLDLSKASPGDHGQGGHSGRHPRYHAVRGHFFRRGETLYWRRAHMRGDIRLGIAAKRYEAHVVTS
jgi:hypothetical protein